MQLREALNDIAEIRAQIARTESLRGLRSLAVSASSLLVIIGAIVGSVFESSRNSFKTFVIVWTSVAVLSLLGVILEMWLRAEKSSASGRRYVWKAHRSLAFQLLPSLVVGGILTIIFVYRRDSSWVLPGMWAMLYGLGLVNCRQHLPQIAKWTALYYLFAGTISLFLSLEITGFDSSWATWQMVAVFGVGQLLFAFLIYWKLERHDGE